MFKSLFISGVAMLFAASALAFDTKAKQAIVMDHATGTVLLNKSAQERMTPSSMSKLMTIYLLFEKLKSGSISPSTTFPVSERAWKMGGSKMFVQVHTEVSAEDLIRGIVVQSGNDACVVVAEALGGSEEGFAAQMNRKAAELGLTGSHFMNSTGWPDPQHYMTAADLAKLAQRLIADFPDEYHYFNEQSFTYNGITQHNRNRLVTQGIGVDGLKTGHTEDGGYGITISDVDTASGRRVIAVVNGLESDDDRLSEARRLAEYGLREFANHTIGHAAKPLADLPVWMGQEDSVALQLAQPLLVTLPKDVSGIRFVVKAAQPATAPVEAGQELGQLSILQGDQLLQTAPLVAATSVAEAGIFRRFMLNLGQIL